LERGGAALAWYCLRTQLEDEISLGTLRISDVFTRAASPNGIAVLAGSDCGVLHSEPIEQNPCRCQRKISGRNFVEDKSSPDIENIRYIRYIQTSLGTIRSDYEEGPAIDDTIFPHVPGKPSALTIIGRAVSSLPLLVFGSITSF
jgi:hypothetical protein